VLAQQAGGHQQQLVAGGVPERVGDLGVVAQRRQDEPGPRAHRVVRQDLVDLGCQPLPVGEAGEPVVVGVVPDLSEQVLLADRRVHVGEHRVQRGAVVVAERQHLAAPVAHLQVAGLPRRGHHGRAQQVGHTAPRERRGLLAVGPGQRDQDRAVARGHGTAAEDVVRIAGAVVPERPVLRGDDEARLLVEVGRQPERDAVGVQQLADGLDDLPGARLVRRHLFHPAGEVVDPLDAVTLAGHGAEAAVEEAQRDQQR
jgi:hypothetical protein